MPRLSIIVPIYNGGCFLRKCIDSILSQTYTDFELILVDDGSIDDSLVICHEYRQKDSRIIVIHTENGGSVLSRKTGAIAARGEYITFVDCDDYIESDMYSHFMHVIEKDNSEIIIGGLVTEYPSKSFEEYSNIPGGYFDRTSIESDIIPRMLSYSGFIKFGILPSLAVKLYKTSLIKKTFNRIPTNLSIGEDVAITAVCVMNADAITIVREAKYHYVQHAGSLVHKFNPQRFKHICNLYNFLKSIDNDDYIKQIDLYISFLLFGAVAECIQRSGYKKRDVKRSVREMLDHDISRKVVRNADISKLSVKDKIKMLLMRYKMIDLLIFFVKK